MEKSRKQRGKGPPNTPERTNAGVKQRDSLQQINSQIVTGNWVEEVVQ